MFAFVRAAIQDVSSFRRIKNYLLPLLTIFSLSVNTPVVLATPHITEDLTAGALEWYCSPPPGSAKCIQDFHLTDFPPQNSEHHSAWTWTFTGCGADPTTISWDSQSQQNPPPWTVTFNQPGHVAVTFWFKDYDQPWECNLVADYYVIGGKFTVTLANTPVYAWQHDLRWNTQPWYLTFFGYDPTQTKPHNAQSTVVATLVGDGSQPAGTEYWWESSSPKVTLVPPHDTNNSSAAQTITIAGCVGSQTSGDVSLYLTLPDWRDPFNPEADITYGAPDYAGVLTVQGDNYRRFTVHAPNDLVLPSDQPHQPKHRAEGPWVPPDQRAYGCAGRYWYRVRDCLSTPQFMMAGVSSTERFPDGQFGMQGNPDGFDPWQTLDGDPRNPFTQAYVGLWTGYDELRVEGEPVPVLHDFDPCIFNGPFGVPQEIWTGTTSTRLQDTTSGIHTGSFHLKHWTDWTDHP